MSCERRGPIANDPNTNLHVIIEDNIFSKLKSLRKHDPFVCKLA
jgi:hypothetical protein